MRFQYILLCLGLCVALLFGGCTPKIPAQNGTVTSQSTATVTSGAVGEEVTSIPSQTATSAPASSKIPTSSSLGDSPRLNAVNLPEAAFDNIVSQISSHGTSVQAYGQLKSDTYAKALQNLEKILDDYKYDISVIAYSIDGGKALSYNTQKAMFCACTVKAAYTLYCCQQMEQGKGLLSTEMTYKKEHYESGTGNMQYSSFGTKFSMDTILRKSMGISDNVGYRMSIDYFGRESYNNWITDQGCPTLTIKPTVWSLKAKSPDLARLWGEIYKYFKTGTQYAEFLYEICTNTPDNYGTLALKNVDISHKQGHNNTTDWPAYSDAGIVWGAEPYVYVVLTNSPGPSSYNRNTMANMIEIIHNDLF